MVRWVEGDDWKKAATIRSGYVYWIEGDGGVGAYVDGLKERPEGG